MTTDEQQLPDLPSLERWGDDLREATEREERRSARFRLPIRRIVVAMAVMLLAVPGAIATRSIWVDPVDRVDPGRDPATTPSVLLAEGEAAGLQWRVGAFDQPTHGRCVQLQVLSDNTEPVGGCMEEATTGPAELTVGVGGRQNVTFVYGIVTTAAAKVQVTLPGGRTTAAELDEPDAKSLHRAGLSRTRVYVAAFSGGYDTATGPPLVVVSDDRGRELGRLPEAESRP